MCVFQSESRDKALQAIVDRAGQEYAAGVEPDSVVG